VTGISTGGLGGISNKVPSRLEKAGVLNILRVYGIIRRNFNRFRGFVFARICSMGAFLEFELFLANP